jgi:hypothetical protein
LVKSAGPTLRFKVVEPAERLLHQRKVKKSHRVSRAPELMAAIGQ